MMPIFEYPNNANYARTLLGFKQKANMDGCSITGGYVYRGSMIPSLVGDYIDTDTLLSGTQTITASAATQTETFTFDDPGIFEEWVDGNGDWVMGGLHNGTYVIEVELNIQGVHLTDNVSDAFTMGGEIQSISYIDDNANILISQKVDVDGRIYFDHSLRNLLTYDINCGLYEDGVAAAVDTASNLDISRYDGWLPFGGMDLQPVNGGTHHIECTVHRDADGHQYAPKRHCHPNHILASGPLYRI